MTSTQLDVSSSPLNSASQVVATALAPNSRGASTYAAVAANGTGASSQTSTTSTSASTITANDFLTLLVSELQNQDPTQPTDPNAYITQMVGVNSLQQLISINQGITSLNSPTATTPAGNSAPASASAIATN
jgi:flagellar basal-body rod modification protein FlgD